MSQAFDSLLEDLAPTFARRQDFVRARAQWLAGLLNLGRHTVTGTLSTAGARHRDWSADNRFLQRLPLEGIFAHVRAQTLDAAGVKFPRFGGQAGRSTFRKECKHAKNTRELRRRLPSGSR